MKVKQRKELHQGQYGITFSKGISRKTLQHAQGVFLTLERIERNRVELIYVHHVSAYVYQ